MIVKQRCDGVCSLPSLTIRVCMENRLCISVDRSKLQDKRQEVEVLNGKGMGRCQEISAGQENEILEWVSDVG